MTLTINLLIPEMSDVIMKKYAKLKMDWLLRGWSDKPFILLNWKNGEWFNLNQTSFYVIQSCDGMTNFNTLAFTQYHHDFLEKLIKQGLVEQCEQGDGIAPSQHYRKASNPYISGIHWAVTGFCNLNCRHCLMESPSGKYGELSYDAMQRIIEQFEEANVHSVCLTGGEPFLRKDIFDLIELLTRKQIWVRQIFSNGTLITGKTLDFLKDLGITPNFQISFDGRHAHDNMRGQSGVEQEAIEAMQRIVAAGFPLVVSTSVDRLNKDSLLETYYLLKDIGVQAWRIAAPQKTGNWKNTKTALTLKEEADIYEPLLRAWIKDQKPFNLQLSGFFQSYSEKKVELDGTITETEKIPTVADTHTPDSYDCGCCTEQPYLLPDGVILPCCAYTGTAIQSQMPNLLEKSLSDIWQSSSLRSITDIKKKDLLAENSDCAECKLFEKCGTGCRALAVTETGELMKKDPLTCALWKSGYRDRFFELYQKG